MRWTEREAPRDPRLDWHRWFAWRPIKIGKTTIWLETVERQIYFVPFGEDGHLIARADYREPQA